ncbi:hypothetical protein BAE44_0015851 [Dichanthelium oligosanthes]|uniref:DUF7595 domain-containing protein n=1 Tax=Dichanthelium oligosanthes TaxID=888268 RepID=A0A1E5VDE3_9POAL|nr:hypothetical protein BAE44_0015851 [Dichanthelium oligosanthes]
MIVLALHADTARATEVELPQECLDRIGCDPYYYEKHRGLLLHATADGRLGMVAAEHGVDDLRRGPLAVEPAGDGRVDRQAIAGQLAAGWNALHGTIKLEGLGERSGTLLFSTRRFGGSPSSTW